MNITDLVSPSFETARGSATLAVNVLVQSSLIIAVGLLAARLLRRHGAAVQATVLRVTLVAVMACPLASWALAAAGVSGFGIELPRASTLAVARQTEVEAVLPMVASVVVGEVPSDSISDDPNVTLVEAAHPRGSGMPFPNSHTLMAAESAQHPEPAAADLATDAEPPTKTSISQSASATDRARHNSQVAWAYGVVGSTWLCGAILLVTRILLASVVVLRGRVRAAAADATIASLCESLAHAIGIRTPPIRVSRHIQSPCLVGVFRPAILLPATMNPVNRDVLVHELAHLRRQDCRWQLLSRLMSAALWFQPLSWWLSRRLEQTADDVADDFVVQFGSDRADYARRLVDIAERYQPEWSAACVGAGIASFKSSLAKRVLRILDTSRSPSTRTGLAALVAIIVLGAACTLVVGLLGTGAVHADSTDNSSGKQRDQQFATADEPNRKTHPVREDENADDSGGKDDSESRPTVVPADATKRRRITGVILGRDGKPFSGASVFVGLGVQSGDENGLRITDPIEAKSGVDGRFEVSYRERDFFEIPDAVPALTWDRLSSAIYIVATAPGFGPGWIRGATEVETVLRLVPDATIKGQLVTLEGAPAANARVRLESIQAAPDNNVQPWLDALRGGTNMWKASVDLKHQNIVPNVFRMPEHLTTDKDGRFRIAGIGRDRIVRLFVEGPSVARTVFRVVARETEPLPTNLASADMDGDKVYGAKFKRIVAPSQPIVGVLRDAETGEPLPNVTIESYQFAGSNLMGVRTNLLRAYTDDSGRFRLDGMPKGRGNRLLAVPNDNQPYFMREIPIPETEGLDPINVQVEMHRGIWITGKVVDKVTREPVMASLKYLPFLSNEYAERLPEFTTIGNGQIDGGLGYQHRYVTHPDGSFRVVGLPGRAVVGAETMSKHRRGAGSEKIEGMDDDGRLPTYTNPLRASKTWPNVMVETNPAPDADSVSVTLEADPGGDLKISVTDSQGKPITGYRVSGQMSSAEWGEPIGQPSFVITGLAPAETRTILIDHIERRLGKSIRITREQSELTVQLEPSATVRGRLVDADGDPVAKATLRAYTDPNEDFNPYLQPITADDQGLFEFATVPVGSEYRVQVSPLKGRTRTDVMRFAPRAGETVMLGDVILDSRSRVPTEQDTVAATQAEKVAGANSQTAPETEARAVRVIRGRVLDPDGHPVAGAAISVPEIFRNPPQSPDDVGLKQEARTGEDGRFQIRTTFAGFPNGIKTVPVIAFAKGFGVAWLNLPPGEVAEDVTLRLTKDEPIRGRVVDTEGRPVADARIDVTGLLQEPSGSLDGFLEAWKNDWNIAPMRADQVYVVLNSLLGTKSDKNGEFEIRGVGLERVADVDVEHPQIASTRVWVVNRPGLDAKPYNDAAQLQLPAAARRLGMVPLLIGPTFSHVVEAGRTIEGVVYTGKDREPVAGAVVATVLGYGMGVSDVTDDHGAYAIHGVGLQDPHFVMVRPSEESALLQRTLSTPLPASNGTVKIDVELTAGAVLTGRVTDPLTGEGVPAGIQVAPLPGNKYFDDPLYDVYKRNRQQTGTKSDGTFRIVTIPGPSVVMAQVHYQEKMGGQDITPFRHASFSAEDEKYVPLTVDGNNRYFTRADGSIEMLGIQNAAKYVDLKLDGEAAHVDLQLDRGKTLEIEILDDTGKPIEGVFAAGVTEHWPNTFRLNESRATVYALGADRPRTLLLLHSERKLAGSVTLKGDEISPVVVKLAPTGSVSGRALDDGDPLGNVNVNVNFQNSVAQELYRFSDLKSAPQLTDAEGRFRIDNIVPGERFVVDFQEGKSYFRANLQGQERTVESGKVRQYNDVTVRKLR